MAPPGGAAAPSLLAYQGVLIAAAIVLWRGVRPAGTATARDLVVELGESRSATMRDALADVLGDPTLRLGYWQRDRGGYVDGVGNPLTAPAQGGDRMMTTIERGGRPIAALVHDRMLVTDSTLADAFAAADRLTSTHAALRADITARVADVSASRRRLQIAADEERHRLEQRLAAAPEPRLVSMLSHLRGMLPTGDAHLHRAAQQLERTLAELRDTAHGLYPRDLADGLPLGLAALSHRCPLPVHLSVIDEHFDPEIEVAAYYLCAEALTNAAKHAQASAVSVEVARRCEVLVVIVADDGVGGAVLARGTGIRGLVDRVEAIGGTLTVASRARSGTTLTAEIPLPDRPR